VTPPRAGRLDTAAVVAAAARIADAEGLEAVTLARVAAELGVRSPSLYHHVEGHAGLLRALGLQAAAELAAALRDAAVGRAREDALRAVAGAFRRYAEEHPGRYAATARAPGADDPEGQAAYARAAEPVQRVIAGWGIEGDEALHHVRVARSALHGFVAIQAAGGFGLALDPDRTFALLVDGLVAALDAAAAGRSGGTLAA
jgi:AcrR family transcriptional regulator